MRFGNTLQQSIHEPWTDYYLDYPKLKSLLRERDAASSEAALWTEDDEQRFTDELVNVQLDKVNAFQARTHKQLHERTNRCQSTLDDIASEQRADREDPDHGAQTARVDALKKVLQELDSISNELSELEKFSRINYTGALKAAKKHDRRRGTNYKVRPLVQVRLAALPFNAEDYSPLLYRLSGMYSFIRQHLGDKSDSALAGQDPRSVDDDYVSYKFFIHEDNLLEVKTTILRHLPMLLYTPSSVKDVATHQRDPTITALYLDSPTFTLYNGKLEKGNGSSSLRLLWYNQLADNAEVTLEKKTLQEGDSSTEVKIKLKTKYVMPFLKADYKLEKTIRKLQSQEGEGGQKAAGLARKVDEIQKFVQDNKLEPMLRANFTRIAFQIPGDDRVRISIDTNLTLVHEDCLDGVQPCRSPREWHRKDIDDAGLEHPFPGLDHDEVSYFPFALMEIKMSQGLKRRRIEWIEDLMASHLVREAPRFSKFLHGVASLFEDHVNSFPFWMSLVDTDIRRDPEEAFQEEQDKKAKQAEDEFVVGSLLGSITTSRSARFEAAVSSPIKKGKDTAPSASRLDNLQTGTHAGHALPTSTKPSELAGSTGQSRAARLKGIFPPVSISRQAQASRSQSQLPPRARKPDYWLKDVGEVRVEPKVWLANQR